MITLGIVEVQKYQQRKISFTKIIKGEIVSIEDSDISKENGMS